jgi:hypothetical protein
MLPKIFAMDKSFMFTFKDEHGQPASETYKIIPTNRAFKKLGHESIVELMQRFLSPDNQIRWKGLSGNALDVHTSKTYGEDICISPCAASLGGVQYKLVFVMTKEDSDEFNGLVADGQNRTSVV